MHPASATSPPHLHPSLLSPDPPGQVPPLPAEGCVRALRKVKGSLSLRLMAPAREMSTHWLYLSSVLDYLLGIALLA